MRDHDLMSAGGAAGLDARRPDAELVGQARAEFRRLEAAYQQALERGVKEASREAIDAAFDEADRLQRQMLSAIRRARRVEQHASQAMTTDADASPGQPPPAAV